MEKIKKRFFGKTGIEISEIGFGAWPIGGSHYGDVSDSDGIKAIETYVDAGGNHIDTARGYGNSEKLIGQVLNNRDRKSIFLASKTMKGDCKDTIPEVREELEESLRQLDTDYLDLYYLHIPPDDIETMNRALDEFEALKQEGKIKFIGASIKAADVTPATLELCHQYINTGRVDALEVVYSILRQLHVDMFDNAFQKGVAIIARTAMESGFLSGKYKPDSLFNGKVKNDHRNRWSAEKQKKIFTLAEEMKNWAIVPPYETLAQVAIKFSLAPKQITSLIVGAKNAHQVQLNVDTAQLPDLRSDVIEKLANDYSGMTKLANIA
jgi:aryl-alcohol dehydrogenase-like predicted oxidoreductase